VMQRRTPLLLCSLIGTIMIAGCANVSTDPHTGGLAGGVNGLMTGAYDQRIAARQDQIADLDAAGDALNTRVGAAQGRLQHLEQRLANQKKGLEKLRRDLAEIDLAIASSRASASVLRGAKAAADADNAAKEQARAPLQAERETLDRMVRELEENHRIEAMQYERGKRNPGSSETTVAVAESERRAKEFDQKQQTALLLLNQMKSKVAARG